MSRKFVPVLKIRGNVSRLRATPTHFVGHLPTDDHRFCADDTCGCHEEPALIGQVNDECNDGLLTPAEATRVMRGRQI
ncbi:MAG: hypothetical protein J2P37_20110 [Ktedonobacteraceae bacterium]|nr:hypothetical protein [Ktedonobacteraceae bacterium]MBO0791916.1 hypothetical protein [Ktedonobacteraceae bacterium]